MNGFDVVVVEAGAAGGLPAAAYLLSSSPRTGYRIDFPSTLFSTIDGAGRSVTFYADRGRTAEQLARFSATDAQAFLDLATRRASPPILAAAFFAVTPARDRAVALTPEAIGLPTWKPSRWLSAFRKVASTTCFPSTSSMRRIWPFRTTKPRPYLAGITKSSTIARPSSSVCCSFTRTPGWVSRRLT